MSRLEEKLQELGYRKTSKNRFAKGLDIVITRQGNELFGKVLDNFRYIDNQRQINHLQKALDEMKKDLEVLRNVESER